MWNFSMFDLCFNGVYKLGKLKKDVVFLFQSNPVRWVSVHATLHLVFAFAVFIKD